MLSILDTFRTIEASHQLAHAYILDQMPESSAYACFQDLANHLEILPQDQHWISTDGNSIAVDAIRDITHRLSKSPIGKRHLVGIHPADKLNTQASNALLKCLEEPPGNTCFLLLTAQARQLLPTIRSRCQIIRSPLSSLDHLSNHPDFKIIESIYRYNPAALDEKLLGLELYRALGSQNPFTAIEALEIPPRQLIQLSLQILASQLLDKQPVWEAYDQLFSLYKDYQRSQNLNDKGVTDRVALILSRL